MERSAWNQLDHRDLDLVPNTLGRARIIRVKQQQRRQLDDATLFAAAHRYGCSNSVWRCHAKTKCARHRHNRARRQLSG